MEFQIRSSLEELKNEFETRIATLLNICESPIERKFLLEFFKYFYNQSVVSLDFKFLSRFVEYDYGSQDYAHNADKFNYQEPNINVFANIFGLYIDMGDVQLKLIPQYQVESFRLDFGLLVLKNKKLSKKICIECDGHDYHSGKEQIKSDNQRSRHLVSKGWVINRYSGSEIYGWTDSDSIKFEENLFDFLKNIDQQ